MRFAILLWLVAATCPVAAADEAPPRRPEFAGIDRDRPAAYLELLPTMGTRARIEAAAGEIAATTFEARLSGARAWVERTLAYDERAAYAWRPFDRMLEDRTYGGCADHALAVGCLLRALGVPCVWVKTMDADWIREFRAKGEAGVTSWRGHVFLEVHDGRRWLLFDASMGTLHEDYDVGSRILPRDRFAYDKGGDPFALVLSTRWEAWKAQTRAWFKDFDLAQLPVPAGRPISSGAARTAWIAADNPGWSLIDRRLRALGFVVGGSGNGGFSEWLPRAAGRTLVVASVAGHEVLPADLRSRYVPSSFADLAKAPGRGRAFVVRRTLDDGTRVVLVYGRDEESLAGEIEKLVVDGP